MTYRHGLRVSEAIDLRRDEVDLAHARLWIRRLKRGLNVEHPIAGDELRAIKRYMASRTDALPGCSSPNVGNRSRVNLSTISSPRRPRVPGCRQYIRTCCGTPAASRSPTEATTCA